MRACGWWWRREEKASQTLRQLQKEIRAEKAERERQVSSRNATIQKLREELEMIKTSTYATRGGCSLP